MSFAATDLELTDAERLYVGIFRGLKRRLVAGACVRAISLIGPIPEMSGWLVQKKGEFDIPERLEIPEHELLARLWAEAEDAGRHCYEESLATGKRSSRKKSFHNEWDDATSAWQYQWMATALGVTLAVDLITDEEMTLVRVDRAARARLVAGAHLGDWTVQKRVENSARWIVDWRSSAKTIEVCSLSESKVVNGIMQEMYRDAAEACRGLAGGVFRTWSWRSVNDRACGVLHAVVGDDTKETTASVADFLNVYREARASFDRAQDLKSQVASGFWRESMSAIDRAILVSSYMASSGIAPPSCARISKLISACDGAMDKINNDGSGRHWALLSEPARRACVLEQIYGHPVAVESLSGRRIVSMGEILPVGDSRELRSAEAFVEAYKAARKRLGVVESATGSRLLILWGVLTREQKLNHIRPFLKIAPTKMPALLLDYVEIHDRLAKEYERTKSGPCEWYELPTIDRAKAFLEAVNAFESDRFLPGSTDAQADEINSNVSRLAHRVTREK